MFRFKKENNLEQFVKRVKTGLSGKNPAQDIREAVAILLKSYGIETPAKK